MNIFSQVERKAFANILKAFQNFIVILQQRVTEDLGVSKFRMKCHGIFGIPRFRIFRNSRIVKDKVVWTLTEDYLKHSHKLRNFLRGFSTNAKDFLLLHHRKSLKDVSNLEINSEG